MTSLACCNVYFIQHNASIYSNCKQDDVVLTETLAYHQYITYQEIAHFDEPYFFTTKCRNYLLPLMPTYIRDGLS